MPPLKVAQMVLLHGTGGVPELQIRNLFCQLSRYEWSLNEISSWTTGPNSKLFHRIVPLYTLHQNCKMVPLCWTKGLPELQIRNIFKRHLLLSHWSKFKLISQNCYSWCLLPKLHKWFHSIEQRGCQSSRKKMYFNDISSWTTDSNSKLVHRNVPHDALYQNRTNSFSQRKKGWQSYR